MARIGLALTGGTQGRDIELTDPVRHVSHTGMSGGRDLEKEGMLCTHR